MSLFRMVLSKIGIENSTKKGKHYGNNMEIRELSYTVGMKIGAVTMENSMEIPQNTRATIWSRNLTPGHITRQNSNPKRYMHPYVHSSTTHNSQDMETI